MDLKALMKMMGLDKDMVDQLVMMQTMLNKLPKEKRVEVVTNFSNELQKAVAEVEDGK